MDSFERIHRKNPLTFSRMYSPETIQTVATRTTLLASPTGQVGMPWDALQEAFYGDYSDRLILIDYEALAREPKRAIDFIYASLGLAPFEHDFDNVVYDEGGEFDRRLGLPGLHQVKGKVRFADRPTILPPEIFQRFSNRAFWRDPRANARKVKILLPSDPGPTELKPIRMVAQGKAE